MYSLPTQRGSGSCSLRRTLMSVSAVVDDAGVPNTPDVLNANRIVWEQSISQKWWHNAHEKASQPLAFSNAAGRPRAPVQDALFWFRFNNLLLGVGSG